MRSLDGGVGLFHRHSHFGFPSAALSNTAMFAMLTPGMSSKPLLLPQASDQTHTNTLVKHFPSLLQQSLTLSLPLLEHLLFYRAKLCLWVSYNTLNSLNILSFYPLISMIFISTPPPRSIPERHTLDPDNVQDTSIFEDTNASFPHSRSRSVLLGLLFQLEVTSPEPPIFPPGASRLLASLL